MNLLEKMNLEKILLIVGMIIFSLLAILIVTNNIKWFDDALYKLVSCLKCDFCTILFNGITFLCSTEFILVFVLLMLIFSKKHGKNFTVDIIGCVLMNQLLKHIFVRTRPVGIGLISESGYSFPSGHSMAAVAFYGFFIYLILNSKLDKYKKIVFSSLLLLLILLVGVSRIYLGVHYASDVLAGFSIATVYLILFNWIYKRKKS